MGESIMKASPALVSTVVSKIKLMFVLIDWSEFNSCQRFRGVTPI